MDLKRGTRTEACGKNKIEATKRKVSEHSLMRVRSQGNRRSGVHVALMVNMLLRSIVATPTPIRFVRMCVVCAWRDHGVRNSCVPKLQAATVCFWVTSIVAATGAYIASWRILQNFYRYMLKKERGKIHGKSSTLGTDK